MGISATKNGDLSERCAFNQTKVRDQISQLPWDWPSAEVLHRPEAQLQRFVSGDSVESGSFLVRKNGGGTNDGLIYLMYVVLCGSEQLDVLVIQRKRL